MAKKVIPRFKPEPRYGKTFIREWREHRNLSLEQVAERVSMTHASLSRIERGKQPYSQPVLEALAEALGTDPASLLVRNPADAEGIWSLWDRAKPGQRQQIVDIVRTILRAAS